MVVNLFEVYVGACIINMILGLTIQSKIEKRLDKARVSYKGFKNMIDDLDDSDKLVVELQYCYTNEFLEVVTFSCVPILHLFSTYMYSKFFLTYKKHMVHILEVIDLYKAKTTLNRLKKHSEQEDFYDKVSNLLNDNRFEYKDVIIKSLNMLADYINRYESIKIISNEDECYKKELKDKLNESINKFNEMSKELIALHNKNNYNFSDLDKLNSLLDSITKDIKNQKAIFITK